MEGGVGSRWRRTDRGRGSGERGAGSGKCNLVADAGDTEAEPIELIKARRDDGEIGQFSLKFAFKLKGIDY